MSGARGQSSPEGAGAGGVREREQYTQRLGAHSRDSKRCTLTLRTLTIISARRTQWRLKLIEMSKGI